jgi:hypothetical protein
VVLLRAFCNDAIIFDYTFIDTHLRTGRSYGAHINIDDNLLFYEQCTALRLLKSHLLGDISLSNT